MSRLNIGCGLYRLKGWVNIDSDPATFADQFVDVRHGLPFADGTVTDVYAGHFLEHLNRVEAGEFLDECYRVLGHGGHIGIVVPDFREIVRKYLDSGTPTRVEFPIGKWRDCRDLDEVCDLFIYSTAQDSPHQWMYDESTLGRLLKAHKFRVVDRINPWTDRRIPVGAWYQFGLDAIKE